MLQVIMLLPFNTVKLSAFIPGGIDADCFYLQEARKWLEGETTNSPEGLLGLLWTCDVFQPGIHYKGPEDDSRDDQNWHISFRVSAKSRPLANVTYLALTQNSLSCTLRFQPGSPGFIEAYA